MNRRRRVTAVLAVLAGLVSVTTLRAAAVDDPGDTGQAIDPAHLATVDGTYVGDVRTIGADGATVEILVAVPGRTGQRRLRLVVGAGLLARTELFDDEAHPFEVVVLDGVLVAAHMVDDGRDLTAGTPGAYARRP